MPPPLARAKVLLEPDATQFGAKAQKQIEGEMRGRGRTASAALAKSLKETGGAAKELTSAYEGLHLQQSNFVRGAFAATLAATGLRGAVLAAGGGFLTGAGIVRGIERFLGLTVEFERSMNTLQAVTAATSFEMQQASEQAIRLGADLTLPSTSAKDAAVSMTELARGGFDVEQAMAGVRGALTLATAAGTDFATAAQIAARAINAFGLEAEDTVRVADALANAANRSTGEITDMAISLQQSSAVAHQVGLSLEDTVTSISLLANAGLVGSDAGTSLRTMLLRLVPQSQEAADAMADLGVATTDAAGRFRSVQSIFEDFRQALAPLPDEMRQAALNTIFGADAIRAANIFVEAGASGFDRMRLAVGEEGAAAELAAARNRGLTGAFGALQSNVETLFVSLGLKLAPAATAVVNELNAMVNSIAHSEQTAQLAQATFDALAGAFTLVAGGAQLAGAAIEPLADVLGPVVTAIGGAEIAAFGASLFVLSRAVRAVRGGFVPFARVLNSASGRTAALAAATAELAAAEEAEAVAASATVKGKQAQLVAEEAQLQMLGRLTTTELRAANVARTQAAQEAERAAARLARADERLTAAKFPAGGGPTILSAGGLRSLDADEKRIARATAAREEAARRAAAAAGIQRAADARLIAEQRRLGTVMGRTTTIAKNLGSGISGLFGGPWGLAITATAALAAGLVYLATRASDAEKSLKDLEDATKNLADLQESTAQQNKATADAIAEVAKAENGLEQAHLNVAIAQDILNNSTAAEGSRERLQLQINLRDAVLGVADAEKTYTQALATRTEQERTSTVENQKRRRALQINVNLINKDIRALFQEQFGQKQITQRLREVVGEEGIQRGLEAIRQEFIKRQLDLAKELRRQGRPELARSRELLAEFAQETGQVPSQFQVKFITDIDRTPLTLRDPILIKDIQAKYEALGFTAAEAFALALAKQAPISIRTVWSGTERVIIPKDTLAEGIGQAFEQGASRAKARVEGAMLSLSDSFRRPGIKWGFELINGLVQGIETEESRAETAAREALANVIKAGNQQIQDSVNQAKTGLASLGNTIADALGAAIDAGPVGQKIQHLQDLLDRLDRAATGRDLARDVREAKKTRDEARASLQFTTPLTPAQAARQRKLAADFMRPHNEAVTDALDAQRRFTIEGTINTLTKRNERQKAAIKKGINDATAEYQAGIITLKQFNARIATILGSQRNTFRIAGRQLGSGFVLGFRQSTKDLFAQAGALFGFTTGKFAGVPGAKIERPRDTQIEVARRIAKANEDLRKAVDANRKSQRELTTALNKLRLNGIPPAKALKKVVQTVENATIIIQPPKAKR